MISPDLQELIRMRSVANDLDPALITAIVMQETGGNPWLTRFEPEWHYWESPMEWASKLRINSLTERTMQAMSWGPMQIMGSVAREMGFDKELPRLAQSDTALFYSLKKFVAIRQKYPNEHDAIASWNAGSPRKTTDGRYVNQSYVDGVLSFLALPPTNELTHRA